MKTVEFKERQRVKLTMPYEPEISGVVVCDKFRSWGVLTVDLDNGRKVAAPIKHLRAEQP